MADVAIKQAQVAATPSGYSVPGAQEIVLKSVRASFDGTGAGGSYVPVMQIVEPGGTIMIECQLGATITAGASVDVSWFPGVDQATAAVAAADTFWPAADQTAASYDKTTWANSVSGVGHYDALKYASGSAAEAMFATAHTGDTAPRTLIISTNDVGFTGGILMGDGSFDPFAGGNGGMGIVGPAVSGNVETAIYGAGTVKAETGKDANSTFILWVSLGGLALTKIQSSGLGTPTYLTLYSGHGVPTIGGNLNDAYFRQDGGAGSWLYRCSAAGVSGVATWAAMV